MGHPKMLGQPKIHYSQKDSRGGRLYLTMNGKEDWLKRRLSEAEEADERAVMMEKLVPFLSGYEVEMTHLEAMRLRAKAASLRELVASIRESDADAN